MSHGRNFTLLVACIFYGFSQVGHAEAPVAEVRQALDALHGWLGNNENARQWKSFLRSEDLAQQLAKGEAADRQTLQEIRAIYSGSESGLDRRRFVAVRQALDQLLAASAMPMQDLPGAVRAAKESFRPIQAEDVSRAREKALAAVRRFDSELRSARGIDVEEHRKLIDWEGLQKQLAEPSAAKADELDRIATLYRSDESGLEASSYAAVRQSLNEYAHMLRLSTDAKVQETYAQNLDELAKRLESLAAAPQAGDLAATARALSWLERSGQARDIVTATRGRFQRPNFFASASEKLVQASFSDPETQARLNRPQGLRDNILGTSLHGTVYPSLELSVGLIPSEDYATVNMRLDGGASSQSVGYKGPVTVWTAGYTQIAASKNIYVTADGVTTSRTAASCWTSSTIQDIAAKCGLIEKFAWKQAGKQKGQAERIASSHAEARIAGQVDAQVNRRLAEADDSVLTKVRDRLRRRDSYPKQLKVNSTDDRILVHMLHATPNQLATPTDPPKLAADHDLSVRLHETLVMNFGESLLAGETLTDERLVEMLTESDVEIPEELKLTPDKDPWSITFSPVQPVTAQFDNNRVKFAIHGRRFTRGDQIVRADIEISAEYQLERQGDGSKLTRQGEVSVEYVNRRQLSVREVAMKTFFRRKFDALFKPEFTSAGPKLPERMKAIGQLKLRELSADEGWLILAWEQSDKAPEVAAAVLDRPNF